MIELEWFTQSVRVGDLKGLPNNPRKITDTERNKLMRSLEKWNVVEIPVCNQDLTLISGNQRVGALVMLGRENEMIDVRVPNRKLKSKEVKELALIGNTHNGEWDFDLLKEHYVELGDLGEFGIAMPVDIPPMDTTGLGGGGGGESTAAGVLKQITLTFSPEQMTTYKNALEDAKNLEEFRYVETFGNENSDANAIYFILSQWEERRTLMG